MIRTGILLDDLRSLVADLGREGGLMSPSLYDTAQVLRLCPPDEGVREGLNWLLSQQHPIDGGWGDPAASLARHAPTLASVLVLNEHAEHPGAREAVRKGLAFLKEHEGDWAPPLPNDLPGGAELLFPRLLDEAEAQRLGLPSQPYAAIKALGKARRELLDQMLSGKSLAVFAGTTAAHSFEGWATKPELKLFDGTGGVGHSPAATAAWVRSAAGNADPEVAKAVERAKDFLARSSRATGLDIPGVTPTSWPIDRFEQAFGLYALLLAGLLEHPALQDVVQPQLDAVVRAMRPDGLGFTDHFRADGDDTAAAVAALRAAGRPVDPALVERFREGDHFCAWPRELQPSLSVTAHAIHALALFGRDTQKPEQFLLDRQKGNRWSGDKWNGSWIYTTSQVIAALSDKGHDVAIRTGVQELLKCQDAAGGWGTGRANAEETAYALFALRALPNLDETVQGAVKRAERWMLNDYRPFATNGAVCWLGKEPYRPHRLSRLWEVAAMVGGILA